MEATTPGVTYCYLLQEWHNGADSDQTYIEHHFRSYKVTTTFMLLYTVYHCLL